MQNRIGDSELEWFSWVHVMTTIRIRRLKRPFRDRFSHYPIMLDGREVARLGWGETAEFNVEPGTHRIHISQWLVPECSETVDIVPTDELVSVEVAPAISAIRAALHVRQLGQRPWYTLTVTEHTSE